MPDIILSDGKKIPFSKTIDGFEIAKIISKSLAKDACVMTVNGELKDLGFVINNDVEVKIITSKDKEGLDVIRHDAAHILAMAVQELFKGTQVTIGPVIENGFYYDFAREEPLTPEDLEKIEACMAEIIAADEPFVREVWDRDEAIAKFSGMGEKYKAELIEGLPAGEDVSVYHQGDWFDLCRGPHLPSTGHVGKGFKLLKLAGAYWRGDSRNAMLQRIYGTAWRDPKELRVYLHQLEEAEKRDHRRLGREMDLFHFQEEAVGSAFWHPKGWTLYRAIEDYMRARLDDAGYQEVKHRLCLIGRYGRNPVIGINSANICSPRIPKTSGHWRLSR